MLNIRNFLKVNNPISILTRLKHGKHNKKYLYKDGQLINNTIYYYPRRPDEVQPVIEEPSKLFRVERIRGIKGNPYWERRLLREFGLMERPNVTIVKNIPENNARLWKIKHLIKVTPIQFPHGEPTADDLKHTFLKENGDCVVIKNIETLNKRIEATENFRSDKNRLDSTTLKKDSRLKWLNSW